LLRSVMNNLVNVPDYLGLVDTDVSGAKTIDELEKEKTNDSDFKDTEHWGETISSARAQGVAKPSSKKEGCWEASLSIGLFQRIHVNTGPTKRFFSDWCVFGKERLNEG
jgi:hypothetical protein